MKDMLAFIFERQLELQRSAFGIDPGALPLERRIEYINWNLTALVQEIAEARDEIAWKPWADDHMKWIDTSAFVGEMVDVLHFFVNALLAVDVTPEELHDRYLAKREVNSKRQHESYEMRTGKCPSCGRATDEPT